MAGFPPFKFWTVEPLGNFQLVSPSPRYIDDGEPYVLSKSQQKRLIHIYIMWRDIDKQIVDFSYKCVGDECTDERMEAYSHVIQVLNRKNKILSNLSNEVEHYARNILNSFMYPVIMSFKYRYWSFNGKGYRRLKATNPLLSGTNRGAKKVIDAS